MVAKRFRTWLSHGQRDSLRGLRGEPLFRPTIKMSPEEMPALWYIGSERTRAGFNEEKSGRAMPSAQHQRLLSACLCFSATWTTLKKPFSMCPKSTGVSYLLCSLSDLSHLFGTSGGATERGYFLHHSFIVYLSLPSFRLKSLPDPTLRRHCTDVPFASSRSPKRLIEIRLASGE